MGRIAGCNASFHGKTQLVNHAPSNTVREKGKALVRGIQFNNIEFPYVVDLMWAN